jgi:hypothetical protein
MKTIDDLDLVKGKQLIQVHICLATIGALCILLFAARIADFLWG